MQRILRLRDKSISGLTRFACAKEIYLSSISTIIFASDQWLSLTTLFAYTLLNIEKNRRATDTWRLTVSSVYYQEKISLGENYICMLYAIFTSWNFSFPSPPREIHFPPSQHVISHCRAIVHGRLAKTGYEFLNSNRRAVKPQAWISRINAVSSQHW